MTSIEFYTKFSAIMEQYKHRSIKKVEAVALIGALNAEAKRSNLELEADVKALDGLRDEVLDEDYYYDDDSSYDESYDESY
jgi:hypothetical protein